MISSKENYKGCTHPLLPSKKYFGNNDNEFVEKRRQELQVYLQMLASNPLIKHDPSLFVFLTSKDRTQFDQYKQDNQPITLEQLPSIPLTLIKNLQFNDTINFFYDSIKGKIIDKPEPEELKINLDLGVTLVKIQQYTIFLNKNISLLETSLKFKKHYVNYNDEITHCIKSINVDKPELTKSIKEIESFQSMKSSLELV